MITWSLKKATIVVRSSMKMWLSCGSIWWSWSCDSMWSLTQYIFFPSQELWLATILCGKSSDSLWAYIAAVAQSDPVMVCCNPFFLVTQDHWIILVVHWFKVAFLSFYTWVKLSADSGATVGHSCIFQNGITSSKGIITPGGITYLPNGNLAFEQKD